MTGEVLGEVLGIDVSHHDGEIDWEAVAGGGFRFVYAKATEGASFVDPQFAGHWPALRASGLLRGAYHFARPKSDAVEQADLFVRTVGPLGAGDLPPALDLEVDEGQSPEAIIDWTVRFVEAAEAQFRRSLVIYTGRLWRSYLNDPLVPALDGRMLWTARYGPDEPHVPRQWPYWDFWQFTDGQSGHVTTVPGVDSSCDVNRFRGGLDELRGLAELGAPPPAPECPPWPGRLLSYRSDRPLMKGDDVRRWQARMIERGFRLDADGAYGPASSRACTTLQQQAGLSRDGVVGPRTWQITFGPLDVRSITG